MKSNNHQSPYFSKKPEQGSSVAEKKQSPYLKAILSGDLKRTTRVVQMTISDRLAAIRYIRESKWRHNFFG
ncbi:MAG: hypothetical protein U0U70_03815 [Chitinophagaceae bacterium]